MVPARAQAKIGGSLDVSIAASAGANQPFTFSASVATSIDFWNKVPAFVSLQKAVAALTVPASCPNSWVAKHAGITALCNSLLGPIQHVKVRRCVFCTSGACLRR